MMPSLSRHFGNSVLDTNSLLAGDPVFVLSGPLQGLDAVLVEPRENGRWVVKPVDSEPGFFLVIDELCLSSDLGVGHSPQKLWG